MNRERARELRRKMTDTERFVWQRLRGRRLAGCKFRRQMPLGPYILDFVCLESRLILELDGGQHVERAEYDRKRTLWLESESFEVLRFWNHEVLQDWEVVEEGGLSPSPGSLRSPPSPARGEGRRQAIAVV